MASYQSVCWAFFSLSKLGLSMFVKSIYAIQHEHRFKLQKFYSVLRRNYRKTNKLKTYVTKYKKQMTINYVELDKKFKEHA